MALKVGPTARRAPTSGTRARPGGAHSPRCTRIGARPVLEPGSGRAVARVGVVSTARSVLLSSSSATNHRGDRRFNRDPWRSLSPSSSHQPRSAGRRRPVGRPDPASNRPRNGRPRDPRHPAPNPPAQFPAGRGAWGPTAARVAANWPRWPPAEAGKIERPRKLAVLVDLIHGGCCGIHRRCRAYCPCWCGIPISQLPPPPWHSKSPTTEAGHAAASAPKVRVQKTNHSTAARLTVVWLPTT